jgi:GR25 family glycosyltransferase involved in LPS biosynthesis
MDTAYVINLASRPDRWEQMKRKWSSYFNLVRVDACPMEDNPDILKSVRAAAALGWTHMSLLKDAVAQGLQTILVLEDDAVPESGWFERWKEIKTYLDSHLDEWETFNGGIHFLRDYHGVKKLDKSLLIDGSVGCASHFMYLNLKSVDKFLDWTDEKQNVDMFYCNNFKLYCAFPILSKQADGPSDIMDEVRSWDETYLMNEQHFKYNLRDLYLEYKHIRSRF